jgi:uncharacterized protein (DUF736 family)
MGTPDRLCIAKQKSRRRPPSTRVPALRVRCRSSRSVDPHRGRDGRGPISRRKPRHGNHRHFHPYRERLHRLRQDAQPQRQDGEVRAGRGDNKNGPDYRIFAGATEFGAAWKKRSDKGNDYLSVKLDDPSFPAPIFASLVETEGEELALIWSRRRAAE